MYLFPVPYFVVAVASTGAKKIVHFFCADYTLEMLRAPFISQMRSIRQQHHILVRLFRFRFSACASLGIDLWPMPFAHLFRAHFGSLVIVPLRIMPGQRATPTLPAHYTCVFTSTDFSLLHNISKTYHVMCAANLGKT